MADQRRYFRVSPKLWAEPWDNDTTLLALYILTCKHRTTEGLFHLPMPYITADLVWPAKRLSKPWAALLAGGFIRYDDTSQTVLICKALEYQPVENPNHITAAIRVLEELPPTPLLADLIEAAKVFSPTFAAALVAWQANTRRSPDAERDAKPDHARDGIGDGIHDGIPDGVTDGKGDSPCSIPHAPSPENPPDPPAVPSGSGDTSARPPNTVRARKPTALDDPEAQAVAKAVYDAIKAAAGEGPSGGDWWPKACASGRKLSAAGKAAAVDAVAWAYRQPEPRKGILVGYLSRCQFSLVVDEYRAGQTDAAAANGRAHAPGASPPDDGLPSAEDAWLLLKAASEQPGRYIGPTEVRYIPEDWPDPLRRAAGDVWDELCNRTAPTSVLRSQFMRLYGGLRGKVTA